MKDSGLKCPECNSQSNYINFYIKAEVKYINGKKERKYIPPEEGTFHCSDCGYKEVGMKFKDKAWRFPEKIIRIYPK